MANPRLKQHEISTIWLLRRKGGTIDSIFRDMVSLNMPVSRGSVQKYVKEYDNAPPEAKEKYLPVDWNRLEDYGLPAESRPFLLSAWFEVLEAQKNDLPFWEEKYHLPLDLPDLALELIGATKPTVGTVRWWWFIHQSAPTAPPTVVIEVGLVFMYREYAYSIGREGDNSGPHHLLPHDHDDIWAYLAYRPWEESQRDAYEQAIEKGLIKRLSLYPARYRTSVKIVNAKVSKGSKAEISDDGRSITVTRK